MMKDDSRQMNSTGLLRAVADMLRKLAFMLIAVGDHEMRQSPESSTAVTAHSRWTINIRSPSPPRKIHPMLQTQNCLGKA